MVAEQAERAMDWDGVFAVAGVWEEGVATFNGQWEVERATKQWRAGQSFTIDGTKLAPSDGKTLSVIVSNDEDGYICSHTSGADLFQGRLSADNRRLEWSDGAIWGRLGGKKSALERARGDRPSVAASLFAEDGERPRPERSRSDAEHRRGDADVALSKPSLSLVQVMKLQEDLCVGFMDADFQERLEELEATHGRASEGLTSEHKKLFLTVEDGILPRYGLDRGQKGVRRMLAEFDRFRDNEEVAAKWEMINEMLGLEAPSKPPRAGRPEAGERQEEGDEEVVDLPVRNEEKREEEAAREPIEVVVRHLTEDAELKVRVPWNATFRDVKEAASELLGRPEILRGRLVTRDGEDGAYSALEDYERVGGTRRVLCKASLRARAARPEARGRATAAPASATAAPAPAPAPVREAREAVAACRRHLEERRRRGRAERTEALRRASDACREEQRGRELEGRRRLPLEEQRRLELAERSRSGAGAAAKDGAVAAGGVAAAGGAATAPVATPAAVPTAPPAAASAASLGRLLVLGGEDEGGPLDSAEVLEARGAGFRPGPRLGEPRSGFAAVDVGGGHVLLAGGSAGSRCLDTTELLDPAGAHSSTGPRMGSRRAACAAARISEGQVLVLGGRDRSTRLDTSEILDLKTMALSPGPRMMTRRSMFAVALLDASRLLVIGGHDGSSALDTTEVLNLRSMTFSRGPRMRSERFSCAACMMDEEHLLVLGGVSGSNTRLASTEVLDLEAMEFSPGPAMSTPRSGFAAMVLDENRLIAAGGFDGKSRHYSSEVLNMSEWEFSCGPPLQVARSGCAAVSC